MQEYAELIRKLAARINNMIEHSEDEMLQKELKSALSSLYYTPPEAIGEFGDRISYLLVTFCGSEDTDWRKQVIKDWTV